MNTNLQILKFFQSHIYIYKEKLCSEHISHMTVMFILSFWLITSLYVAWFSGKEFQANLYTKLATD